MPSPPPDEPSTARIPDHVEVADEGVLTLGQTLSVALAELFPRLVLTWRTMLPMLVLGNGLLLFATTLLLLLVGASVGGLGYAMNTVGPRAGFAFVVAYVIGNFILSFVFMFITAIILSPFYVAMARSSWAALQTGEEPSFIDGIRGGFRLDMVLAVAVLVWCNGIGYAFFFLPGIVIDAMTNLVLPGMVVDGLGFWKALGRSLGHFFKNPFWHVGLALTDFVTNSVIGTFLPLIGTPLIMSVQVHMALHAYNDAFPRPNVPSRHSDGAEEEAG